MKNFLRTLFGVMMIMGAFFLNDRNPKGPYTLAYEIGLVAIGAIGLVILWLIGLWKKDRTDKQLDGK